MSPALVEIGWPPEAFRHPEVGRIAQLCRRYRFGDCTVLCGREPTHGELRWHLSISHPDRLPTWDEVHDARYELVPDHVTMVMILPPRSQYVNVHQFCFHLHEIPEAAEHAI